MSPQHTRVRFGPECIRLGIEADDWQAAVRAAGEVLVDVGATVLGYGDRMVRAIETFGPYVVVAPGIALVHARPDRDVLENAAALVTVPEGVSFGHPDNDPVRVVVALAVMNHTDHVKIVSVLARALDVDGALEWVLDRASSPEQLAERVVDTLYPLNIIDAKGESVRRAG